MVKLKEKWSFHKTRTILKIPFVWIVEKREKKRCHIATEEKKYASHLLSSIVFARRGCGRKSDNDSLLSFRWFIFLSVSNKSETSSFFPSINCGYAVSHPFTSTVLDLRFVAFVENGAAFRLFNNYTQFFCFEIGLI